MEHQKFDAFELSDLKLVYRVLHSRLMDELDLLDSGFFSELQTFLQGMAQLEGVDVSDHGQWDAWLEQVHTPCAVRLEGRRTLHN